MKEEQQDMFAICPRKSEFTDKGESVDFPEFPTETGGNGPTTVVQCPRGRAANVMNTSP